MMPCTAVINLRIKAFCRIVCYPIRFVADHNKPYLYTSNNTFAFSSEDPLDRLIAGF